MIHIETNFRLAQPIGTKQFWFCPIGVENSQFRYELWSESLPKVHFDCPKIGFSDWLSTGGGFPKSDPGLDGGGAPKRLLGGVGSGIEGGRPAGFLKIPNEEVSEVDSSFTAVSFDAVKPLDWIQFSTETDRSVLL